MWLSLSLSLHLKRALRPKPFCTGGKRKPPPPPPLVLLVILLIIIMGFLPISGSVSQAVVHPNVIFNVCDSYVRRNDNVERVIGTLLGHYDPKTNRLEVTNSYAVPHNVQQSTGQVLLDVEFHRAMIELHTRVNPKEVVIGWYSTGDGIVRRRV